MATGVFSTTPYYQDILYLSDDDHDHVSLIWSARFHMISCTRLENLIVNKNKHLMVRRIYKQNAHGVSVLTSVLLVLMRRSYMPRAENGVIYVKIDSHVF